jgi:poly-gamma-glutamate biosynthesis protein PgsC/CapC
MSPDAYMTISLIAGILIALLISELLGVSPGGLVVVGFLAAQLGHPLGLVGTLATAVVTFLVVRWLGRVLLLYGRRRLVLVLMLAVVVGLALGRVLPAPFQLTAFGLASVGRVVPGLLANALDTQGPVRTLPATAVAVALTALVVTTLTGTLPAGLERTIFA